MMVAVGSNFFYTVTLPCTLWFLDHSIMSPATANCEVYKLLKNGVKVSFRGKENEQTVETVRVIDWNEPSNNDFFLASHKRMEHAYRDNLRDYKNAIPQIFWYNGFIILSNGSQSKIGSMTAEWEHFEAFKARFQKKIND